jgi:hypothetical protein
MGAARARRGIFKRPGTLLEKNARIEAARGVPATRCRSQALSSRFVGAVAGIAKLFPEHAPWIVSRAGEGRRPSEQERGNDEDDAQIGYPPPTRIGDNVAYKRGWRHRSFPVREHDNFSRFLFRIAALRRTRKRGIHRKFRNIGHSTAHGFAEVHVLADGPSSQRALRK